MANLAVLAALVAPAGAQAQPPRPQLTALVAPAVVAAGASVRASLRVRLPGDVHVQSDRLRDPALIATALLVGPADGVALQRITYPAAADLQHGTDLSSDRETPTRP